MNADWVYGLWWGLGCLVGLGVPLLAAIVALTWTRRELVAMVREWVDRR
jgi:IMP dehydrogenase/GMP reductase